MRYQFVDCRWELGDPARGRALYLEGHIPGAAFLDVDEDLSDTSVAGAGREQRSPTKHRKSFGFRYQSHGMRVARVEAAK